MSNQNLTAAQMEVLDDAARRVGKLVEETKGKISLLAGLPGGEISPETGRELDQVAEEAKNLLIRIDDHFQLTIPLLKHLPEE